MSNSNDKIAESIAEATLKFLQAVVALSAYSAVVWALVWLATPLFHLPAINYFEVVGALGLGETARSEIVKFKRMLFGL